MILYHSIKYDILCMSLNLTPFHTLCSGNHPNHACAQVKWDVSVYTILKQLRPHTWLELYRDTMRNWRTPQGNSVAKDVLRSAQFPLQYIKLSDAKLFIKFCWTMQITMQIICMYLLISIQPATSSDSGWLGLPHQRGYELPLGCEYPCHTAVLIVLCFVWIWLALWILFTSRSP